MHANPTIIQGNSHLDTRGSIRFCNSFDMSCVKRFYCIDHGSTEIVRAWRGHRTEQRWFNVISGTFLVKVVKIDNWISPDQAAPISTYTLSSKEHSILHIPQGYATGIQALEANSSLLVFADFGIEHAIEDDYLFEKNYFGKWEDA